MVIRRSDRRRGGSGTGCLVWLVVSAVVLFYGVNLGKVWWRYWEIKDRMQTAVRLWHTQTDAELLARLRKDARDIGLPAEAARFRIVRPRTPPSITISTQYRERVDLPLIHRTFEFKPSVRLTR